MISLNEYLKEYITESKSPTSDNAIWFRLGIHKFLWSKPRQDDWIRKYNISKQNPREGIIRMAKDLMVKPLKSEQEVIGRSDWGRKCGIGSRSRNVRMP